MRNIYLKFLLVLILSQKIGGVVAQIGPRWKWAASNNGPGSDYVGLVTDIAGNVYTVGRDFAKYSPAGVLQWSKDFTSNQFLYNTGLAQDAAGNLYLTGYFAGNAQLDTATLIPKGHTDIFVAKFNSNGQVQWAKSFGGPGPGPGFPPSPGQLWDAAWAIAADSVGNCYFTGICENGVKFDSITTDPTKGINFIAKLNSLGKTQWVRSIPRQAEDIAVGPLGSYFITGYAGTISLPPGSFTSKYNANGTLAWTKEGISLGTNYGKGITIDVLGNCLVTGVTYDTIQFDNVTVIPTQNSSSMYLLKYDAWGNLLWVLQTQGNSCGGENLITDSQGNILVTGEKYGTVNFSGVQLTGSNNNKPDIYAVKYAGNGNIAWVIQAGSGGSDYGKAIGVIPSGEVYVAGNYQSGCNFDTISLNGKYSNNSFVAQINVSPLSVAKYVSGIDFQLYPNPTASEVTISGEKLKQGNLTIYNLTGQKIYESQIDAEMKVNVANWPDGVYALKLTSGSKTITRKLVVTH